FNSSNGKWYSDSGLTTESVDDAVKIQLAANYAVANGISTVYIPSGTWYMKTKQGSGNEFIRINQGNIHFCGDGYASVLFVVAGINISGGGYAAIIGNSDNAYSINPPPLSINNITVSNLSFDHNSPWNQWASGNMGGHAG